ncbi:hypothetical protein [Gimesia maris]|uniref:hypothetical protein n=1 Tax=Gimesia maris TaxID=122 RepID=UPI003A8F5DD0
MTGLTADNSGTESSPWSLRICVAIHFLAVVATAFLGRLDIGAIQIPVETAVLFDWFALPCMASLYICPAVSLLVALRSSLPPVQRVSASVCTIALFVAHFIAFLPMVQ